MGMAKNYYYNEFLTILFGEEKMKTREDKRMVNFLILFFFPKLAFLGIY